MTLINKPITDDEYWVDDEAIRETIIEIVNKWVTR